MNYEACRLPVNCPVCGRGLWMTIEVGWKHYKPTRCRCPRCKCIVIFQADGNVTAKQDGIE